MPTTQDKRDSRTNESVVLAPDQFVIDPEAFVTGDDEAYSMCQANVYFGGRHDSTHISAAHADVGVVVGGQLYQLPTFDTSKTRRKTSKRACQWFQRVRNGTLHDPQPTSAERAGLERTRKLAGSPDAKPRRAAS